ncbi:procathepsin L-like [Procambarus clarkii]|uniref:procathepsin L-like n=1 Tax=Procambarus clarkii TaxID=6728 RepID=UPI001E674F9C|nr:procathepsin L-like [Procambarus clarkii]
MKVTILLLCGLALAAAHPTWEEFKAKYGRKYKNSEEENHRKSVFQTNLQFIVKFSKENSTHNVAMNEFGDMTNEEFNKRMNGYVPSSSREANTVFSPQTRVLPAAVDWRTSGYVTPVKNQLQCGSCWAFSATGSLEGQQFRKSGKLVRLSEQQLVDCAGGVYQNQGCNGGLMNYAFNYLKAYGSDSEASYPYVGVQGTCKFSASNIAARVTGYVNVASQSESALMTAIATVGPISVAIDAGHSSFQFYSGGVYYEPTCSSTKLNHGVLAVGYGTDTSGKAYYIVKNSWGTTWGSAGYILMARNRNNNCGIATAASYPTV